MRDKLQQGWREPGWLNYCVLPVSWLYLLVSKLRQLLYRIGVLKCISLPVPVVVVGGVTVGGSGKTPLVVALVKHLKNNGFNPGIISRGYRGQSTFWPREVDDTTTAALVGDEPQLIYELTGAPVVVGPQRPRNGYYLIDKFECDVLISDDGFQHFALDRDIDIVVIDSDFGFGNGWCLPAGPLREPKSSVSRADLTVVNGTLSMKLPGNTMAYTMRMQLNKARSLNNSTERLLSNFSGAVVHAVAGVGNPERFFNQLEQAGLEIVRHAFPDHHTYSSNDLKFDDDGIVLMTEKDGIKCKNMSTGNPIWVVPAELSPDQAFYDRVDQMLENYA